MSIKHSPIPTLSHYLYLHFLPPRFRARTAQDKYSVKQLLCVSSRRVPTTATARTFWRELRPSVHMGPEDFPLETAAVVKISGDALAGRLPFN